MPPRRRRRRRISRKLLIWIGSGLAAAILLPVLVALGLIAMIDPNSYKEQLEGSLRQVIGRDLRIRGHLSVSASLSPTIEADDVTLANMQTGSRADMVRVEHMTLELAPRALLTGRLVVSRITLDRPDILIETDAEGHGNWRPAAAAPPAPADDSAASLALLTVHLRDGHITWRNGATGGQTSVELRRLAMTSSSLDAPVVSTAELIYGRQRINFSAQTGPWNRLLDASAKAPWGLFVNAESDGAKITVTGALTRPREWKGYSLRLDAAIPDLDSLSWLSPWPLLPLHNFTASARLLDTGGDLPDISGVLIQCGFTNLDKIAPGFSLDSLRIDVPRLSEPVALDAEGTFASAPLTIAGTLGAPALLMPGAPTGQSFVVDLKFEAGGASFAARGAIAEPAEGKGMDIAVGARIPDLALLVPLAGVRLPALKTVAFAGQLADGEGGYRHETVLRNIALTLPQGDVSGELALAYAPRPRLRAALKSVLLDVDSLLAAWNESKPAEGNSRRQGARSGDVTAPPPLPRRSGTLIPDARLGLDVLHFADADLRLAIDQLHLGGVEYRDLDASVVLSDGRLVVNPLAAELGGGRAELRLAIGSPDGAVPIALAVKTQGVDLKPLLPAWGLPALVNGRLDADVALQATGSTWHELAASAGGRLALSLADGEIDTRLAGGVLADVLRAARTGSERIDLGRAPLRCLSLALDFANGNATVSQAGLDSAKWFATATGWVNFAQESMMLQLRPALRTAQSVAVVPLKLENLWQDPKLGPDQPLAARAPLPNPADACVPLKRAS